MIEKIQKGGIRFMTDSSVTTAIISKINEITDKVNEIMELLKVPKVTGEIDKTKETLNNTSESKV